jgi:predicted ATPase
MDFEHGVFYVSLAPLTSADNIVTTIINVLGIVINEDSTPKDELVKFLSRRNLLLVMDNFEHVLEGVDIVADILHNADRVKILVTSREVLNLTMEHVWHVRGMRYPDSEEPDDINQYDALTLFIERAMQIRQGFSPSDEQITIIQICQRVDGLPLAIELAVGWLKTLSCNDILNQIEQGIDFLTTRNQDVPERHRSIRAVFNHTWNLLSADEQSAFLGLTFFRSGFTLEAAEHVANADLIVLSGLVDKSMVRHDANGRYDLHELLRQYGQTKLSQSKQDFELMQQKYMEYFSEQAFIHTKSFKSDSSTGHAYIASEKNNLIDVWELSVRTQNIESLSKLWEVLFLFFYQSNNYLEGEEIFGYLVDNFEGTDNNIRVIGFTIFGWFNLRRGKINKAITIMERSQVNRNPESKAEIIHLIHYASALMTYGNYDEAGILIPLSLKAAEKLQDPYYLAFALYNCGYFANLNGKGAEAQQYLQRSLEISRQMGLDWGTGLTLLMLGTVQESMEQYDDALKTLEESYSILEQAKDYWGMVFTLSYSCRILLKKNNLGLAHYYLQRAFDKALESENISAVLGVILDSSYYLTHLTQRAE